MIRQPMPMRPYKNTFCALVEFKILVKSATIPSLGITKDRMPGANPMMLSIAALCSWPGDIVLVCFPFPAATEAVVMLMKT